MAYDRVSPFGDERDDMRAALIASLLANIYRKRGVRAFNIGDFMLTFEPRKEQTAEEIVSTLKGWLGSMKKVKAK